jgi:hypothetical protein
VRSDHDDLWNNSNKYEFFGHGFDSSGNFGDAMSRQREASR